MWHRIPIWMKLWMQISLSIYQRKRRCSFFFKDTNYKSAGLCEWDEPDGGMFLWLKVKNKPTPDLDGRLQSLKKLTSGKYFMVRPDSTYIRICFSEGTAEELENVSPRTPLYCTKTLSIVKTNARILLTMSIYLWLWRLWIMTEQHKKVGYPSSHNVLINV